MRQTPKKRDGSDGGIFSMVPTIIRYLFWIILLAVVGTTLGFVIWEAVFMNQMNSNKNCLPSHLRDNECLIGIADGPDSNHMTCSYQNAKRHTGCNSACLTNDGSCNGQGTCVGNSRFVCVGNDTSTCPTIGFASGVFDSVTCELGGCNYYASAIEPMGACGSSKAQQNCIDALNGTSYQSCLNIGQFCDSGLVIACVYTDLSIRVTDFS